jgi:polar amino acid transport system substrate-binding protein
MRAINGRVMLFAAISISLLCSLPASAQVAAPQRFKDKGKIVYCTDLSDPPWEYVDPTSFQPAGVDIEIGAAVARAMGLKSETKNITFAGIIPAVQAGQCDAIISTLIDKPERREVLDFVDYAIEGNALIVLAKSDLYVNKLSELSGKKIVVQSGTQLLQDLQAANEEIKKTGKPEMNIVSLPNQIDAIQMLFAGLADGYYNAPDEAAYFNTQHPGSVKVGSPAFAGRPVGIATNKRDHDLGVAVAAAFQAIRASGEYDAILKKAGLEDLAMPK